MAIMDDDLGHSVEFAEAPQRIVSLVPSLTEAIEATRPGLIVGATDYCIAPRDLDATRIGGTKNPNHSAIADLKPDLIVANCEENRRPDVELLRSVGLPVWVTKIDTVDEALTSLRRLLTEVLALPTPDWLTEAEDVWSIPPMLDAEAALAIWRDPWMVVGGDTYSSDVLARIGVRNVFGDKQRYPRVTLDELAAAPIVLLPDEPYKFTPDDGPESFDRSVLYDGRATSWYGPAMVWARPYLEEIIDSA